MVDNTNQSKNGSSSESGIQKYIGVASVNVLAVNPKNETLRKYGWQISDDAQEPVYMSEMDRNGKKVKTARVRFLVQLMDLQEKPVIPLDFWVHNEWEINKEGTKCKIIDSYVRSAWATKDDIKNKRVPQYSNGPASISPNYAMCHIGEESLLKFLFKYLNITPFRVFDKSQNAFVPSKNPGRLSIDNWLNLCIGEVQEIKEYVALQPDNCVKVILGIRTTEDNKTYQTFMTDDFLSNGSFVNKETGEYTQARKLIDNFVASHQNATSFFEATPVREWKEEATEVTDNSGDMPDDSTQQESDPFASQGMDEDPNEMPF